VEIVGAGAYQADIAAYLAEEGIRPGMLRAGLDAAAWEEKLSWRYPETAWFHVYAAGMTLRWNARRVIPCRNWIPASPVIWWPAGTAWWRRSRFLPGLPPSVREPLSAKGKC